MAWSGYSEKGQGSAERGPGTFAFAPPGTPVAQASLEPAMRAGNQGTQLTGGAIRLPDRPVDKTLDALAGVAAKLVGPALERARDEAFLKGMQRAASGEALTEIINERPWYSKIFGEGAGVDGARAYTQAATISKWATDVERAMPELRKQSPDAIPGLLAKQVEDFSTGDTVADNAIRGEMLKVAPQLIARQTKEHFKFLQERTQASQLDSMMAMGASYQLARATGTDGDVGYTPDELDVRTGALFQALAPAPGQTDESYETNLKLFVGNAAEAGQFHAIAALEEAGALSAVRPEARLPLQRAITASQKQHATQAAEGYIDKLFSIKERVNNGEMTGPEVIAEYDAINADYTGRTGNPQQVIARREKLAGAYSALQVQRRLELEQAKAINGAKSEAERIQELDHMVRVRSTKVMVDAGIKAQDADDAFKRYFDSAPNPQTQARILAHDAADGRRVDYIQTDVTRMLQSAGDNVDDNYLKAYGWYKELKTLGGPGDAAIGTYFGSKESARMAAFDSALGGRPVEQFGEYAYAQSRKVMTNPGYTFKAKEKKEVDSFIDKAIMEKAWYKFGVDDLTGHSKTVVRNLMAEPYGTLVPNVGQERAMSEALMGARARGLETFGKYAWITDPGRPRVEQMLLPRDGDAKLTSQDIGKGLNSIMEKRIRAATDKTPEDVMLLRVSDNAGQPQFLAYIVADGVVLPPTVVSGDDIYLETQEMLKAPVLERSKAAARAAAVQAQAAEQAATVDPTKPYIGFPSGPKGYVPLK